LDKIVPCNEGLIIDVMCTKLGVQGIS